jgi:hypothetical protein
MKIIYDRQSVGESVLVSGTHLDPATNFSFVLKFSLDSCGFVILYRPLWREDVSVIYCTIASGPCQSSHSWVEVPQNSRPYFTVSFETPPTRRANSPYLYPPGTGGPQLYPRALDSLFVASYDSQGLRWRYSNPPSHGSKVRKIKRGDRPEIGMRQGWGDVTVPDLTYGAVTLAWRNCRDL